MLMVQNRNWQCLFAEQLTIKMCSVEFSTLGSPRIDIAGAIVALSTLATRFHAPGHSIRHRPDHSSRDVAQYSTEQSSCARRCDSYAPRISSSDR